ncbi:envelope glycoprotein [Anopheles sinensis]|uniref:Envelope glycoprotein n=1 Tax=Anopheles sinensis TaxID=74873 RepID=A0A084WJY8_ANOSI|nr:envelope glycoprotein [Anopheles sinensis]
MPPIDDESLPSCVKPTPVLVVVLSLSIVQRMLAGTSGLTQPTTRPTRDAGQFLFLPPAGANLHATQAGFRLELGGWKKEIQTRAHN